MSLTAKYHGKRLRKMGTDMSQDPVEIRSLDGSHVRKLEHLDWTPGCEDPEGCTRKADGIESCRLCGGQDSLMCDEHHMMFVAEIAEAMAEGRRFACLACHHELHPTADRDWRPL